MADGCQQIGDYSLGASAFENAHSVMIILIPLMEVAVIMVM